ncbi:D(1) dopamine receptor-like [Oculina patagonica]
MADLMEENHSLDDNLTAALRTTAKTAENSSVLDLAHTVSLSVIGCAVLVSNTLVCILFCRYRRLRTITNTFIVSLAISDLMVATVFLPTYLAGLAISPYIIAYILFAYLFNFCGITWDRYEAVLNPLSYRSKVTRAVVYKILALVWTIPFLLAIIPIFWEYRNGIKMSAERIYQGVLITIVTMCSVSICWAYSKIFRATRRQVKWMIEMSETNARIVNNTQPITLIRQLSKRLSTNRFSTEVKAAKVFALVGLTFAVCWLPLIIINVFFAIGYPDLLPIAFLDVSLYSLVGNALADPLIYSFYKSDYRRAIKRFFRCCKYGDENLSGNSTTANDSVFADESCNKVDNNLL